MTWNDVWLELTVKLTQQGPSSCRIFIRPAIHKAVTGCHSERGWWRVTDFGSIWSASGACTGVGPCAPALDRPSDPLVAPLLPPLAPFPASFAPPFPGFPFCFKRNIIQMREHSYGHTDRTREHTLASSSFSLCKAALCSSKALSSRDFVTILTASWRTSASISLGVNRTWTQAWVPGSTVPTEGETVRGASEGRRNSKDVGPTGAISPERQIYKTCNVSIAAEKNCDCNRKIRICLPTGFRLTFANSRHRMTEFIGIQMRIDDMNGSHGDVIDSSCREVNDLIWKRQWRVHPNPLTMDLKDSARQKITLQILKQ